MKRMKKLLSLLLVFTMMLTLVGGAVAFAADDPLPEEELLADVEEIPDVEEAEEDAVEETAEEADAEVVEESDELAEAPEAEAVKEAAPALDGAANQLAAGNTYYLVSGGNYVYCEDGALNTKDAKVSGSEVGTKNPRGIIVASAGQGPNGGVTLMFSEGSYYLGVSGGAMVATSSAPQGEWILDGGKLYFDSQNGPAYVTDWSAFAVSSDAGAAVAVTAYSTSGSSSSGDSETTGSDTAASDTAAASDSSTFEEWRGPFSGPTGEDTITVAFDISGKTIKFDHGQLSTADVVMSGDKMVIDANFVNVKAKEGGGYIFYTDAPESKLDCLYVDSDGKLANTGMEGTIPSGYWSINEGGGPSSTTFTYTDGDVVWYLMVDENGSIVATTDSSAAVKGNFYSGSAPADMGGGGGAGGKNNVYGLMSTNPNLVKVDAPHWVNISKADRETTKDVTLTAKFPEGVKGLAMIFKWTFGDQTKEEEFPATGAEDEEFTSTFTANIADLEAGVYEVQCEISYKIEKAAEDPAEEPVEEPSEGTDPAEQPSDAPAGEAGEATDFVIDGQFIIVVVGADGKDYAISKDGSAVPYDGTVTSDILWNAAKGGKDGVFRLTNAAGDYLTYNDAGVVAGTKNSSWLYADGTLAYTSKGNPAAYITGVNGAVVTLGASGSAVKLYTPGAVSADGEGEEFEIVTINAPVAVNIILAKGIQENTLITFSDVHESWSDVGTAIKDTILSTGGYIPSIVLATGDFNNNRIAGFAE